MTFAAIPVDRIPEPEPIAEPAPNDDVFTIAPDIRSYRVLLSGGFVLDVSTPYKGDSNDRTKILAECSRRWGKRNWRIEGMTEVAE